MNGNLLIIGADCCGLSAKETAIAMGCFENIAFLDDNIKEMPDGSKVLGTIDEFEKFTSEYSNVFAAVKNSERRLNLLRKIKETTPYVIVTLVSPNAYISPSAQIMCGSLVEALAVINTGSVVSSGCIIEAGSVVNHCSMCCEGVYMECNATVAEKTVVPAGTHIKNGEVFKRNSVNIEDLFFNAERVSEKPYGPVPFNGTEYCFEDGM